MKPKYGARGTQGQRNAEQAVVARIVKDARFGHSIRLITEDLNADAVPSPAGRTWNERQVRRIVEQHQGEQPTPTPAPVERKVPDWYKESRSSGDVAIYDGGDKHAGEIGGFEGYEEVDLTDADSRRLQANAEEYRTERKALQKLMRDEGSFRFHDPKWHSDLLEPNGEAPQVSWLGMVQSYQATPFDLRSDSEWNCPAGHLGQASKDKWNRDVDALVAEMTRHTGKDVMALIDRIEGQPDVKGPLRTVAYGLLREIALQRQINLALRQAVVRLKGGE